jgi:signal transduction histidine kinase
VKNLGASVGIQPLLTAQSGFGTAQVGAMISRLIRLGGPLSALLRDLCRLVDAALPDHRNSVLLAPALPRAYDEFLEPRPVIGNEWPGTATDQAEAFAPEVISDAMRAGNVLALAQGLPTCYPSSYPAELSSPNSFQAGIVLQFAHMAGVAVARARTDEALKRSEAFLAEVQRVSSTGSFSWCVASDEITWSQEIYRIFELDQQVSVTLALILTRVHPEDVPLFDKMLERVRSSCGSIECQHRLRMPDHTIKHVRVVAQRIRGRDGGLEYIGAIQDVTQRRLLEEALGKLRSELAHVARVSSLGALSASIAHEVNQPLAGIIANASTCLQMLAAESPDLEGARETARRTIRDGERACNVVARLRVLFGKKGAKTESLDLNSAAREVIALSSGELRRRRVNLQQELDDLPPVTGDRVQLQQVILNLLLNASEAMSGIEDRPRRLVIRTEREGNEYVRLSVEDTGGGFEPQDAERLFEAFYTTKSGGMGIGLSVSRSIIESHEGRLWAEPNDGHGATFSFSIPATAVTTQPTGMVLTPCGHLL